MKTSELKVLADNTIQSLVKHEVEDFNAIIDVLAQIPIRDYTLHFALENPDLRSDLIASLDEIVERGNKKDPVVFTLLAGIYWLDSDSENTASNVESALELNDQYSLARLMNVSLKHGVPSRVWEDSLRAVTAEECLTGAV